MIYSNSYFKKTNFQNKKRTFTKTWLFKRVEDATWNLPWNFLKKYRPSGYKIQYHGNRKTKPDELTILKGNGNRREAVNSIYKVFFSRKTYNIINVSQLLPNLFYSRSRSSAPNVGCTTLRLFTWMQNLKFLLPLPIRRTLWYSNASNICQKRMR